MEWPEDDAYSPIFAKRYSIMVAEESSLPIIYYRSQNMLSSKSYSISQSLRKIKHKEKRLHLFQLFSYSVACVFHLFRENLSMLLVVGTAMTINMFVDNR